jgi:multidrug resistance protein, MATE family
MTELALPVVIVQVGLMAMGVADTIMVGHVSATDLAAVALGNLYYFAVTIFGVGVLMALDPIVSQAVGSGDDVAVARGVQRGLVLTALLSLAGALLILPVQPVLVALRQPAEVVPVASGYVLATLPGVFPFLAFVVLRQSLQAMKRLRPIVITIVAANLANVLLNWMFIFGNLGVPPMGAVGSGWASSISRWLMALGLLALAWRLLRPYLLPLRRDALSLQPLLRMVRLGTPIGFQFQLEYGAFSAVGLLMGLLGAVQMAGHQIALNLASLTFMVPMGISAAAAVLVGQAIGRGDPAGARRAAGAAVLVGSSFMCVSALVFLAIPNALASVYTNQREVLMIAATLIPIAGFFQVFDGVQAVATGVLRGTADTRTPMIVNLIGFWMIGMPVSIYLGFRTGAGPQGLWWGLVVGLAAVSTILMLRVRRRFTRELRRVIIDEEPVLMADLQGELHRVHRGERGELQEK